MKKFFSTLFIAGLALPALAGEPQPLPQGFDYSTVTTHFTGCLDGQIDGMYTPSLYTSDYTVDRADVSDVTARIWEEWKKANTQFASKEDALRSGTLYPFPTEITNTPSHSRSNLISTSRVKTNMPVPMPRCSIISAIKDIWPIKCRSLSLCTGQAQ